MKSDDLWLDDNTAHYREHRFVPAYNTLRTRRMVIHHEAYARRIGAQCEHIDLGRFYKERRGICGICKQPVAFDVFTIDHIRPYSKGGAHCTWNIQLAHLACNSGKGNRLPKHIAR